MCEAAGGSAPGDMSFRRLMTRATISIITWRDAWVNSSAHHQRVRQGAVACLGSSIEAYLMIKNAFVLQGVKKTLRSKGQG